MAKTDWIKKILQYESKYGSASGTGLANFGIKQSWKNKYPEMWNDNSIDEEEAIEFIKKEYLPKVKDYPEDVQKRLVDYAFNTGRSIEDLLLLANGNIGLNDIQQNKTFTNEWNANKDDIIKAMSSNDFIDKLDNAKKEVYRDTWERKGTPDVYSATSLPRIEMWNEPDDVVPAPTTQQQTTSPAAQQAALQSLTTQQTPPQTEENIPKVKKRQGSRINPDGSPSTHLMRREYVPGTGWVAFPSLFQNENGDWVDMNSQYGDNWEPIYQEAIRRGEVYKFGEDEQAAINFADKGNWKQGYMESNNTTNPREEFPEDVMKSFEDYFDLLYKISTSESADERMQAQADLDKLKEEIGNEDLIAQYDMFGTEKLIELGVFDEAGRAQLEASKEQYDSAIKGMADDFALSLINLGVSGAQVAKGLSDLRDLEMPAMPALPQDTPELTQAFGEAQREAQMIDPRLNEARKRAALMTLNQFEEISKTASAGQAGAYGANMQQAVNRVADEMRKGAYEDQLLRQRAQAMYYNLANQKAAEDQFQYGAAMGQFDRRYGEFNVQRAAANTLAQTGFTNLFNTLNQAQGDVNLAQRYKSIRDTFQGRLDDIDAEAQRKMQPNLTTDPNIMAPPPEPEMYVPYTMQPLPKQGSSAFTPRQEPTQPLMSEYQVPNEDVLQALIQPLQRTT